MKRRLWPLVLLTLCLFGSSAWPARAEGVVQDGNTRIHRFTFDGFTEKSALRLYGDEVLPPLYFGLRVDEQVQQASVRLTYRFSPLLTPRLSHVRVVLNDHTIGTLPMTRESVSGSVTQTIAVDPVLLTRFNKLTLELAGNYTNQCQDPQHANLWAEIEPGSEVRLAMRRVRVPNDLALLPAPFFDNADGEPLRVPFVFAAAPSPATLKAAGIVASWFGLLAGWRNPRFPTYLDPALDRPTAGPASDGNQAAPTTSADGRWGRHSVVFATNTERPAFLRALPPFTGPQLRMLNHPTDPYAKLLLVAGRDATELAQAAKALVLGTSALSGEQVAVQPVPAVAPRQAYDVPNWVRVDRPMRFSELVSSPQQLQMEGHMPPPIKINLRVPPDLFTWRSRGVPVELKFRYSPPLRAADSYVFMGINGERVQQVSLRLSGQGSAARVVLPLLDTGLLGQSRELLIPAFKLGVRNQLEYTFSFGYLPSESCSDTQLETTRAMIDGDSKIDFSGHPHYAELPHLGYFATSGFPFTRYADLSQTTVLLPNAPVAGEIETMLALLARMGESTGYPATHLDVEEAGSTADQQRPIDRDLLLVGAANRLLLLHRWRDRLSTRDMTQPALFGLESPLTAGRSVVVATAPEPQRLQEVLNLLEDDKLAYTLHGGAVLIQEGQPTSLPAKQDYTIGKLPFWTAIWYPLSGQPVLLALMSALAVLIFAFALWRTLKATAAKRLE